MVNVLGHNAFIVASCFLSACRHKSHVLIMIYSCLTSLAPNSKYFQTIDDEPFRGSNPFNSLLFVVYYPSTYNIQDFSHSLLLQHACMV